MRKALEPGIFRNLMRNHGYEVDLTHANGGYYTMKKIPDGGIKIVMVLEPPILHIYPYPTPMLEQHEKNFGLLSNLCHQIRGTHLFTEETISQITASCADDICTRLSCLQGEEK